MKINIRNLIIIFVLGLIVTLGISFSLNVSTKSFENDDFSVNYDSTWKVKKNKNELLLEHNKSKSLLSIQSKNLEENYIDTKLDVIIMDILYDIESQNEGYNLISVMDNSSNNYECFSYLYEKDNEQVMVRVYKHNEKIIVIYYEAESKYFDIVLDSVDSILDSLEIYTGEEVN